MTEPERRLAAVIQQFPDLAARVILRAKAANLDTDYPERRLLAEVESFERVTGHNIDTRGLV